MRAFASLVIVAAVVLAQPVTVFADDSAGDVEDPSGHFRLDIDRFGLQAWALAQFPVSDDIAIAANIYALEAGGAALPARVGSIVGAFWRPESRVDAGLIFRLGVFEVFPEIGFAMDFGGTNAVSLVPQLFAIMRGGPVHIETWNQLFLNAMFQAGGSSPDVFYTRNQVLLSPWNCVAFGFQLEWTLAVRNPPNDTTLSLPIGGTILLQPSKTDVIQFFLAYEAAETARNDGHGLAGRLTYLHTF